MANTQVMCYSLGRSNNSTGGNTVVGTTPNVPDTHFLQSNVATLTAPSFQANCVPIQPMLYMTNQNGFEGMIRAIDGYAYGPSWINWWLYSGIYPMLIRYTLIPGQSYPTSAPRSP